MSLTTDPNDPGLNKPNPNGQNEKYLILSAEERSKGFIRPVRRSYKHAKCDSVTKMGLELSETYARDPKFYGATFCSNCRTHLPVDEFTWVDDNTVVGS